MLWRPFKAATWEERAKASEYRLQKRPHAIYGASLLAHITGNPSYMERWMTSICYWFLRAPVFNSVLNTLGFSAHVSISRTICRLRKLSTSTLNANMWSNLCMEEKLLLLLELTWSIWCHYKSSPSPCICFPSSQNQACLDILTV